MAFFIPLLIIAGIVLFSSAGSLFKSLDFSFPKLGTFVQEQIPSGAQQKKPVQQDVQKTQTPAPSSTPLESSQVSPYFKKIEIATLAPGGAFANSLITLRTKLTETEVVDITGWKIKGKAGEYRISQGIDVIGSNLQFGSKNDIFVRAQDVVYLSSARGPFGLQQHFRPNACMGYLATSFSFPLSVPSTCSVEKPDARTTMYFLKSCQDFIDSVNYNSCSMPSYDQNQHVGTDSECTSYLNRLLQEFTYMGCFLRRQNDPKFLSSEWHVYTNVDLLTQRFDAIELRDQNDLLVDKKEY